MKKCPICGGTDMYYTSVRKKSGKVIKYLRSTCKECHKNYVLRKQRESQYTWMKVGRVELSLRGKGRRALIRPHKDLKDKEPEVS